MEVIIILGVLFLLFRKVVIDYLKETHTNQNDWVGQAKKAENALLSGLRKSGTSFRVYRRNRDGFNIRIAGVNYVFIGTENFPVLVTETGTAVGNFASEWYFRSDLYIVGDEIKSY